MAYNHVMLLRGMDQAVAILQRTLWGHLGKMSVGKEMEPAEAAYQNVPRSQEHDLSTSQCTQTTSDVQAIAHQLVVLCHALAARALHQVRRFPCTVGTGRRNLKI